MSDVLDKLIKKAFSPRRGLATRVAKAKADADTVLEHEQFAINAALTNAKDSFLFRSLQLKQTCELFASAS